MKIICIGRNYAKHIAELKNEKTDEPVIFLKPDTALLKNNNPFFYPSFSSDVHYETELLIKIKKEGKFIEKQYAHKYYDEIGLGVDFTARDIQTKLKEKGLPWELAKGFNGAAAVSDFYPKSTYPDIQNVNFHLLQNGEMKQKGNTAAMLYPVDEIIGYVSQFFTLKTGDILFTGTPEGVGPVQIGDRLEGFIENKKVFDFEVK